MKIPKSKVKKLSKTFLGALIILCALGYNLYRESQTESSKRFEVTLNRCVDGDTAWFNIDGKKTKVRFLYIDTPESTKTIEPYGKEASRYVKTQLENAQTIELEYNPEGNQKDKYNRTLAWVFIDHVLLQEKIASQGYCKKFYDYGCNYTYKSVIIKADQEAKRKGIGLYS
ncbi:MULTISPECIES: thermonuclease family protein [Coprobacillaceae]|uniref:thermonuclease family protein n=1 Tax=Coprobacillaceae TaxID=2810280 RepID=UPI000E47DC5A|nr:MULTISPECIES: thermonuclease family protein [Coprobacillaceae]RHM60136.1 hypothetical protein DWZ53_07720 [Coprobacillus sp. AF33-1AC]RHS92587.1 hypothetical protein DW911_08220 [Erysipelatoclostridium sp. AM42-17]